MQNNDNDGRSIGRRRTLQLLTAGLTVTGLGVLAACKDNGGSGGGSGAAPTAAGPQDCNALIDDASRQIRKSLQYKAKADDPNKVCAKCAQFTPEKYGTCGGACKLITGPVKPVGGCLSFAPIGSDPGAAKVPT